MKQFRFFFFTGLFIIITLASVYAELALPHYQFNLKANPDKGRIEGNIVIKIPWTEERNNQKGHIYIALMLNLMEKRNPYIMPLIEDGGPEGFSPSWIRLNNIKINGKKAEWRYREPKRPVIITYNMEHLLCEIDLTEKPEVGSILILEMGYSSQLAHSKSRDDFYFKDKMFSRFSWFPYILPPGLSLEDTVIALSFFTYKAEVSLPSEWEMAAIGTDFKRKKDNTFIAESLKPVTGLPIVFLKNHDVYETKLKNGETVLRLYYRRGVEGIARMLASYSVDILDYYSKIYFPLNYRNISIVQGNPGGGAMAADSLVILGDGLFKEANMIIPDFGDPTIDFALAHEIGHFYFGIGTPPDFTRENYLSEGINEYSALEFIEKKYGVWENKYNKVHSDILAKIFGYILGKISSVSWRGSKLIGITNTRRSGWERPLSEEPEDKIANTSSSTDYDKSFYIIHMLANYLGKENFNGALKQYLIDNRYTMVTSENLKTSLEKYYGKDLDKFFKYYVYGNESADYKIKGSLNIKKTEAGYLSRLTISTDKEPAVFIPSTVTVFMEDGLTREFPVDSPGDIEIQTKEKVLYAALDKDPSVIDYNRKNNFYPEQIVPDWTRKYWLRDGNALLWTLWPYIKQAKGNLLIGIGPYVYDRFAWDLFVSPFVKIPSGKTGLLPGFQSLEFGGALNIGLHLPDFNKINFSARVSQPGILDLALLSYSKPFYIDTELGLVSKYYYPRFNFSLSGGIADLSAAGEESSYILTSTSFEFDSLVKTGTLIDLTNRLNYFFISNRIEDRIGISIAHGFSFIPRTLLGIEVSGSAGFGDLNKLQADNSVSGWLSTVGEGLPFKAQAKVYFGIPGINDIELPIFNLIVLQSINLAIFYNAASAFSSADNFEAGFQQSAGVEVFPYLRMRFLGFPLGMGISLNISRILQNPVDIQNYTPGFFLETDILPLMYAFMVSY